MAWLGRAFLTLLISIVMTAMTVWGALAIYYSNLPGDDVRRVFALAFAIFGAALLVWYLCSAKRVRPPLVFLQLSCSSLPGGRQFHPDKIEIGHRNICGCQMPRSTAT
jgi:hypothetical protein